MRDELINDASCPVIVSGIAIGDSGTGRFVAHLQAQVNGLASGKIKLITKPTRPARRQFQLWLKRRAYYCVIAETLRYIALQAEFWLKLWPILIRRDQRLILIHPQSLGYRLTLRLFESRINPPSLFAG